MDEMYSGESSSEEDDSELDFGDPAFGGGETEPSVARKRTGEGNIYVTRSAANRGGSVRIRVRTAAPLAAPMRS